MLHHFRRVCHKRVTNCPRRRAPRAFFMVTLGAIFPEIWDCLLFGVRWLFRYRYIRHRGCAISLLLNTRNKCALCSRFTASVRAAIAVAIYRCPGGSWRRLQPTRPNIERFLVRPYRRNACVRRSYIAPIYCLLFVLLFVLLFALF